MDCAGCGCVLWREEVRVPFVCRGDAPAWRVVGAALVCSDGSVLTTPWTTSTRCANEEEEGGRKEKDTRDENEEDDDVWDLAGGAPGIARGGSATIPASPIAPLAVRVGDAAWRNVARVVVPVAWYKLAGATPLCAPCVLWRRRVRRAFERWRAAPRR